MGSRGTESEPSQEEQLKNPNLQHFVASYSLELVRLILTTNDAIRIRNVTQQIFRARSDGTGYPTETTSTLLQIASEWISIDLRFHVLSACLSELQGEENKQAWPTARQKHVLHVICALLNSKITLIGLSISDVLDSLCSIAADVLGIASSREPNLGRISFDDDKEKSNDVTFLQLLAATIAALTIHTYYAGQTSDIFRHIMQLLGRSESGYASSIESFRLFHLRIAKLILLLPTRKGDRTMIATSIEPQALTPALNMLYAESVVRENFLEIFMLYLARERECRMKLDQGDFYHEPIADVGASMKTALYRYLCTSVTRCDDFSAGLDIIDVLDRAFSDADNLSYIPMLHRVDDQCFGIPEYTTSNGTRTSRCHLIETMLRLGLKAGITLSAMKPANDYDCTTRLPNIDTILEDLPASVAKDYTNAALERFEDNAHMSNNRNTNIKISTLGKKQIQTNRLHSSVTASRDNVPSSHDASSSIGTDGGLIQTLKKSLLVPTPLEASKLSFSEQESRSISDLFRGIVSESSISNQLEAKDIRTSTTEHAMPFSSHARSQPVPAVKPVVAQERALGATIS